jgi:enoyl-CoA hydratase/carnithine racemase
MVHLDRRDGVTVVRFDRPPAHALDIAFTETLCGILDETRAGDSALVLTGSGSFFSGGLDLQVLPAYTLDEQARLLRALNRLLLDLYGFPHPVVAAVNGHAVAGGMILALACDYRVALDDPRARFGLAEGRVGVAFPVGAREVVTAELAPHAARRMMLTAANRGPEQALGEGALDELRPPDRVLERAVEVAGELAALPRGSYGKIKRQLRGDALARIERAVAGEEPLLRGWLDAEARVSAAGILKPRR